MLLEIIISLHGNIGNGFGVNVGADGFNFWFGMLRVGCIWNAADGGGAGNDINGCWNIGKFMTGDGGMVMLLLIINGWVLSIDKLGLLVVFVNDWMVHVFGLMGDELDGLESVLLCTWRSAICMFWNTWLFLLMVLLDIFEKYLIIRDKGNNTVNKTNKRKDWEKQLEEKLF